MERGAALAHMSARGRTRAVANSGLGPQARSQACRPF